MSMFDSISVYMKCPFCHNFTNLDTQTKDLGCSMFHYRPLPDDWFSSNFGKKFRETLPVFPKFPLDKEADVWKTQAERIEAEATIDSEFDQLKYVTVATDCPKCGKFFDGKIHIQGDKLVGQVYDIVK